jgi:glutamate--cysteine ligase
VQRAKLADPAHPLGARAARDPRSRQFLPGLYLANSQRQAAELIAPSAVALQTADFVAIAQASLDAQRDIERTQVGDFDTFVAAYRASTLGNIAI